MRASAGAKDLEFVVPVKGGFIEGRVVSKKTGKPVTDFEVSFLRYKLFVPADNEHANFQNE